MTSRPEAQAQITFPSYVFLVPIVLVVLIFPAKSGLAAQLAEVRIGSSDISFSNFSTFYARDRGLFEKEGIDAKVISSKPRPHWRHRAQGTWTIPPLVRPSLTRR